MTKPNALSLALRKSGAAVAATPKAEPDEAPAARLAVVAKASPAAPREKAAKAPAPSRAGTASFTVHFPQEVRRQVKMLAAEQGRTMDDLVAEALNLMFVKYRKPEVAPRKAGAAA